MHEISTTDTSPNCSPSLIKTYKTMTKGGNTDAPSRLGSSHSLSLSRCLCLSLTKLGQQQQSRKSAPGVEQQLFDYTASCRLLLAWLLSRSSSSLVNVFNMHFMSNWSRIIHINSSVRLDLSHGSPNLRRRLPLATVNNSAIRVAKAQEKQEKEKLHMIQRSANTLNYSWVY